MVESPISYETLAQTLRVDPLKLIVAAFIFVLSLIVAGILRTVSRRALAGRIPDKSIKMFEKFVYYTVILLGALAALTHLGVNLTGLLVAGGFAGIVLGFAAQSTVANFVSGVFLYFDRAFDIGDPVEIPDAGIAGVVTDMTTFSTRIRTWDGVHVRIPNEKVFTSTIMNYTKNIVRRVEVVVGIAYKEDASRAIEVLKRMLDEHPLILKIPEPVVFVDELGDSSVNLRIRAWTPSPMWLSVRATIVEQAKKALDEAGIEIPFPQRVVWFATPLEIGEHHKKGERASES